jgi:hypothetical protein
MTPSCATGKDFVAVPQQRHNLEAADPSVLLFQLHCTELATAVASIDVCGGSRAVARLRSRTEGMPARSLKSQTIAQIGR